MAKKDYTLHVAYTRAPPHYPNDPTQPLPSWDPPTVTVTGVNVEANCYKGKIQLRRCPTGILLEEVECLYDAKGNAVGGATQCSYVCRLSDDFQFTYEDDNELSHAAKLGKAFADGAMKQFAKFDMFKEGDDD